ncbi:fatty acid desaturase [Brevundimonas aurifodinae]|uniref:Fatty acid desaturase n=2 Tax=Brevundimonas TaxID=41275 RepID=A0ABV1NQ69_9CAUL|nr:MAG: beta-carotene ketolase [Brevundimonas sp. 12-68-7]OYX34255.1 MAG: beta-carotene ketolase [Brevundimonas subvibrioides]
MTRARQTTIGLTLAALIVTGWATLHVWGVFFQALHGPALAVVPVLILTQSWLGAGMFIVAHDAMHGSLAPGRPRLNAVVGQVCVGAYAAFSFRELNVCHHQHHRAPGTADDPDFHADRPEAFLPWFYGFFTRYFGWREFAIVTAVLIAYLVMGASVANLILFWALPAVLSALQLFVFGTWLPHRHIAGEGFDDHHHARTWSMPWIASLLTCFHFGMHHEHHLSPATPWWRLPAVRREALRRGSTAQA